MSESQASAQELSDLPLVLVLYDWLLCLGQEVEYIWQWRSGVTLSSLVYVFSRYTFIIQDFQSMMTIFPMSDLTVIAALGIMAISAFSALRAYALSNQNIWMISIIVLLAIPPTVATVSFYTAPENLPSPFNCSPANSLSPAQVITRASQLAAELLVVVITWWYTLKSHRLLKGVKLGKTISSFLLYNGSIYFLFEIILVTTPVPATVQSIGSYLGPFYDAITSILTCRFMLSLRQFHTAIHSTTYSRMAMQVGEGEASTVLVAEAQHRESLPPFIVSFAHPVHVESLVLPNTDSDTFVDGEFE
ncbi:hypothetical protein V8D89_001395 [Ganoderma adspersum]